MALQILTRVFILSFALTYVASVAIAQDSSVPKGWKKVTACKFSFLLPETARETKTQPVDSCLAGFDDTDIHIGLDYGLYSQPLSQQDWMKNYRNVPITINGREARLMTYEDAKYSREFSNVTEIHMWTMEPSPVTGAGVSLLIGISAKPSVDPKIVKQIYESLKFLGK